MNGEKRYVSGTKSSWNFETPEGMTNSMVDRQGRNIDNGWNFDEWDEERGDLESTDVDKTGWDSLAEGPKE